MRSGFILLLLTLCLGLVGCASSSVTLNVRAIEPVNLGAQQESRVTDIRVYQLTDDSKFKEAKVDQLWNNDAEYLGDTLVGAPMTGVSIFPEKLADAQGKEIVIDPLDSRTKFIGILALYTEGDEVGKRFVSVPVDEAGSVLFELTGYHITVKQD